MTTAQPASDDTKTPSVGDTNTSGYLRPAAANCVVFLRKTAFRVK